jgi:putative membrane protein
VGSPGPAKTPIAHIAYTAGQSDIAAADLARNKTHNNAVKAFAEEMVRDWFLGKSKFPMAP